MKIVMAASEAAPFIKTGGLGDVMEALPRELSKQKDTEVTLFLPYYKQIKENPAYEVQQMKTFWIDLGWRRQYVGIMRLKTRSKKLKIYFIDNEYYFCRGSLYGHFDDGERFAFFSKAVLCAMNALDLRPEILHCHDWQTALIPVLLPLQFREQFPHTKTVFTIHNIEYQGIAQLSFVTDLLGLPAEREEILRFNGCANFMKGAIVTADLVTTVSKSYAAEIQYSYYAHGLQNILQDNSGKLYGIVNGINEDLFNPKTDKALKVSYSAPDFAEKKPENKRALQEELGLEINPEVPVLSMVSRLAEHKGIDLISYLLETMMEHRKIQLVICGTGDVRYEEKLKSWAARYPGKMAVCLRFDPALANRIYAGSDIYLMPSKSEPCGLSQLIAMRYGTIPVVNATGGLRDTVTPYNEENGTGRGFTFQSYNGEDFMAAIDRATKLFETNRAAWNRLVQSNMRENFSWKAPAADYQKLYETLM